MLRLFKTLNRKALLNAVIVSFLAIVLVLLGSRNLQNFDAALFAYLVGTIFAIFGISYR